MKKFKVELEIDERTKTVTIKDSRNSDGELKEFKGGVHLVAADAESQIYYVLSFGSSADLGWALAQVFNDGWSVPFIKRLFYHLTAWVNKFVVDGDRCVYDLDSKADREELEGIVERWKKEDKQTFN